MVGDVLIGLGVALAAAWLVLVVVVVAAHPSPATLKEAVRLLPDTLRLLRRIAADPTTPRAVRLRLCLVVGYLASPLDLIPDFLPGVGHADDALLVAVMLRSVVRRSGTEVVRRHWPGTPAGLAILFRLARLADPDPTGPRPDG